MLGIPYIINRHEASLFEVLDVNSHKLSPSLEDYLEAIYSIIEEKQAVKAIEISRRLGVGRSSVTEALKNLADKKLVNYRRYDVITLTPSGEKAAKKVVLKHRVLYDFFTQILDISPEQAEKDACKIEHVISEEVLNKLIAFIEFNKHFHCKNYDFINEFKNFAEK